MNVEAIQYMPLDRLHVGAQVRNSFDDESVRGLAVSLQEVGQLQPIRVRRDGEIVDGARRFAAAKLAGWRDLAVIVDERDLCPAMLTQVQLIANCQRKNLTGPELARAVDELRTGTGWSVRELAQKLGFSVGAISKILTLLKLPASIQEQIQAGEIPAETGYHLARVGDPERQQLLADEAVRGQLTREEVSACVLAPVDTEVPLPTQTLARVRARQADCTVTVSGAELTPQKVVEALSALLAKARRLKARGLSGQAFARGLRDADNAKVAGRGR